MGPRKKNPPPTAPESDELSDDELDRVLASDEPYPQVHGDGGNLELWDEGEPES